MIKDIYKKIEKNQRLSPQDALTLSQEGNVLTLGELAKARALEKVGPKAAYLIDRNINYTNVCAARCTFCAFYRPFNHKQGYDLSFDEIDQKIKETLEMGGRRILMQGGLHPHHTLQTYVSLIKHIKENHPVHIHAFSPPEIHHVATQSKVSYREVLEALKEAGLESMPGGGAEILVDSIRDKIAVGKCNSEQWLEIMKTSHQAGIPSTATMMLGHVETMQDRIEHMDKLRQVQDETGGFLSFIPWTFQPENTPLHPKIKRNSNVKLMGAYEYLRFLALSRLYLDNFDHIQVSLLTQGMKVAQIGLHFGADDLGSLLIEENVVRMAGCDQELHLEKKKMRSLIEEAGLIPYERDTFYNEVDESSGEPRVLTAGLGVHP